MIIYLKPVRWCVIRLAVYMKVTETQWGFGSTSDPPVGVVTGRLSVSVSWQRRTVVGHFYDVLSLTTKQILHWKFLRIKNKCPTLQLRLCGCVWLFARGKMTNFLCGKISVTLSVLLTLHPTSIPSSSHNLLAVIMWCNSEQKTYMSSLSFAIVLLQLLSLTTCIENKITKMNVEKSQSTSPYITEAHPIKPPVSHQPNPLLLISLTACPSLTPPPMSPCKICIGKPNHFSPIRLKFLSASFHC